MDDLDPCRLFAHGSVSLAGGRPARPAPAQAPRRLDPFLGEGSLAGAGRVARGGHAGERHGPEQAPASARAPILTRGPAVASARLDTADLRVDGLGDRAAGAGATRDPPARARSPEAVLIGRPAAGSRPTGIGRPRRAPAPTRTARRLARHPAVAAVRPDRAASDRGGPPTGSPGPERRVRVGRSVLHPRGTRPHDEARRLVLDLASDRGERWATRGTEAPQGARRHAGRLPGHAIARDLSGRRVRGGDELSWRLSPNVSLGNERIEPDDARRQMRTAAEILKRFEDQPGLILADEVGMGKTYV